jgi:predicted transposase YdaD
MEIPVTLNVKSANVIPVINCMQGDTPTIICTIMNGDDTFIADPGEFDLCVCEGETAKHKAISIKCAVNSNIVTVHLTKNETDEAGDLKLCISFSNTAQELVVSTFPFILKATENPAYSAVGQKENIKALTDYIAEAKKYADAAKNLETNVAESVENVKKYAESASESVINAEKSKKLSQSYAIGDSGVREGEEKDNSKYYSEKSAESKQAADKAAELAGQKAEEARQLGLEASENAKSASESVINAEKAQKLSQSYAIGNSGLRENEEKDNSKYYSEKSAESKQAADKAAELAGQKAEEAKQSGLEASENAKSASESVINAEKAEKLSQSYALGDSGIREGEKKDNSKYYSEKSAESKQAADKAAELAGQKAEEARQLGLEASENAKSASESVTNAEKAQKLSQSYAIGNSGLRENEDTDNSKWYAQQAEKYAKQAEDIAGGNFIPESEKGIAGGVAVLDANLAVAKAVADEDGNNIKESLKGKSDSNHTHPYAGSNTAGGIANSSNLVYATSHQGEWYQNSQWDGTYFQTNYKHGDDVLPMRVGYSGYSNNSGKVNNHTVNSDVPANAKFTDTTYSDATTSAHGLMSTSDKSKLNGIAAGANKTTILNSLAATTTGYALDAIQGKALNDKITAINDSLAHINILYKYDDATLICKQGHVITIYFDCLSVGFERLQDYLTKHTEYCPFKPVLVMVPVWFINENAKYVGYVRITEQGLIYIRYMVASYPNTFTNIASNMGMSGSISYVV